MEYKYIENAQANLNNELVLEAGEDLATTTLGLAVMSAMNAKVFRRWNAIIYFSKNAGELLEK